MLERCLNLRDQRNFNSIIITKYNVQKGEFSHLSKVLFKPLARTRERKYGKQYNRLSQQRQIIYNSALHSTNNEQVDNAEDVSCNSPDIQGSSSTTNVILQDISNTQDQKELQQHASSSTLKASQPIPFHKLPIAIVKNMYYSVVFFCLPQAQFQKYLNLIRARKALKTNPSDTQSYAKLLKLLNASNPTRALSLYEQNKYSTDDVCVAEYLKALVITNNLSRYLTQNDNFKEKLQSQIGMQRDGVVSPLSLYQLLEQLKNQTQGGKAGQPIGILGQTNGQPLPVQIVGGGNFSFGGGRMQSQQPLVLRLTGFLFSNFIFVTLVMFLWIFGLEVLVRRNQINPNSVNIKESTQNGQLANPSPYSPKEFVKDDVPIKSQKTFRDVLGCDESKEELEEIVQFLKNPEKFKSMGASLPKGVLLTGPPGTGKTLLAKAVAGEADVPFFYRAGSEFEEMFVGVGARRVRELFKAAKKKAPCIVFVDEIDAVGGSRKNVHNHRKTLNQFLSEMDGFEENNGVIVIAATNLPETLDQALIRPGRFDRIISVPLPDVNGRDQILKYYLNGKPVKDNVNSYYIAQQTKYFSGADLYNLVNESALQAAKLNSAQISLEHLEYARDKILMGKERRSLKQSEKSKQKTAIHEAGHAMVAMYTQNSRVIHKATIIPRGQALGMVTTLPKDEDYNSSRSQLLAEIDVALGGLVAEELKYGADNVSNGASSDLKKATKLSQQIICHYGMSSMGLMYLSYDKISSDLRYKVDSEIQSMLLAAKERVYNLLSSKSTELNNLSKALYDYETLTKDDIQQILKGTFNPKQRQRDGQKANGGDKPKVQQQQPQTNLSADT